MELSNKKTLVILAGGLGSRYNGQKQLDSMGPSGESLMEYSIYDAIKVGFNKFILIINDQFLDQNKNYFSEIAHKNNIELHFVVQKTISNVPDKFKDKITSREKPWGTAHALLCTKDIIVEPFAIINADDFYGRNAYKKSFNAITNKHITKNKFQILAYPIAATLSENGSVSRGICSINSSNELVKIEEQTHILKKENRIFYKEVSHLHQLKENILVSMNFWILHPIIFSFLEKKFIHFLEENSEDLKKEFFIPQVIDELINENSITVNVVNSDEKWFGVTYPEDKKTVQQQLINHIKQNIYPDFLWNS